MLERAGFTDVQIGDAWDTFEEAGGETNARAFEVYGFPFLARVPGGSGHRDGMRGARPRRT
jgi:hypothetical protein